MKVGIEVEGRLLGLKTIFINHNEIVTTNLSSFILDNQVQQLYISDNDNKLDLYSGTLYELSNLCLVTVERTVVDNYPLHINIMLNVVNSSFWNLRRDCQVKFSQGLNVYATTPRQMIRTIPEDFSGDITL